MEQPLTLAQLRRIDNLTSADELNDQDFALIDQNLTAAKAYGYKVAELEGLIEMPDYIGLYQNNRLIPDPITKPALANIIDLFPHRKLLTPRTALPMAASTDDLERETGGGKTYLIQTSSQQDVRVSFEFRTNPMTKRVTTKLRLSVPQALAVDITIAWLPPQVGDDVFVSPILQCKLKAGQTDAVVTRVFEPKEWEALPLNSEFGEVDDISH